MSALRENKTWNHFKTHFADAQADLELEKSTQGAGYHGANNIQEGMVQVPATMVANLAQAREADQQQLANLTLHNQTLTDHNSKLLEQMSALLLLLSMTAIQELSLSPSILIL